MTGAPIIRTFAAYEWPIYKELRLRALADSPDAFGSTLAKEEMRTDAEWAARLNNNGSSTLDLPVLAEFEGKPAGMCWGRIEEDEPEAASLYQMWVDPDHRCMGVGKLLLDAVIDWAEANNAKTLDLGVTWGDTPAVRLYTRAGFEPLGELHQFRPGSDLLGRRMRLTLRK
jgi:ribosomal protein S18 acetylase RimI-like enzyme